MKAAVVALGLAHHLVTPHTSLVAVDVTPARPEDAALDTQAVATNLPHGWSYDAVFGELPQTATPLPMHAGAALLALLFAGAALARRPSLPLGATVVTGGAAPRGDAPPARGSRVARRPGGLDRGQGPPGPAPGARRVGEDAGRGRRRAPLALGRHAPGRAPHRPRPGRRRLRPGRGERPDDGLRPRPPERDAAAGRAGQLRGERPPRHALRVPAAACATATRSWSSGATGGAGATWWTAPASSITGETWVLRDAGDTRLTLVTCYPFDALRPGGPLRYVVTALLAEEPGGPPQGTAGRWFSSRTVARPVGATSTTVIEPVARLFGSRLGAEAPRKRSR